MRHPLVISKKLRTTRSFLIKGKERKLQYQWYHNFRSYLVRTKGFEPSLVKNRILSPARLPVPSHPHIFNHHINSTVHVTLAVPKILRCLNRHRNFDRCAILHSLYPPPAAVALNAANSVTSACYLSLVSAFGAFAATDSMPLQQLALLV